MKKFVTGLSLFSMAAQPAVTLADEFRSGDRVEGAAAFFMCAARDDLAAMNVLDRQGDRPTALKLGMERCESGRPGYKYMVMQVEGDAVCIRSESTPYCMWVRRSSLRATPSQ